MVTNGGASACAILDDDTLKCWGGNSYGQVGSGSFLSSDDPALVQLPAGRTAKSSVFGLSFACSVLDDDTVWCWGHNMDSSEPERCRRSFPAPVQVCLSAGGCSSRAVHPARAVLPVRPGASPGAGSRGSVGPAVGPAGNISGPPGPAGPRAPQSVRPGTSPGRRVPRARRAPQVSRPAREHLRASGPQARRVPQVLPAPGPPRTWASWMIRSTAPPAGQPRSRCCHSRRSSISSSAECPALFLRV